MSNTVTQADLFTWLARAFQVDASELTLDRTRESLPTWDSMGTLLLIAELDENLHLTFSAEELQDLASIADLVALLRKKGVEVSA